ncbi:hypothetical protein A1D31_38955 [Bradyrhizobium liaoningense]|nr:hypothetical protein A1D31_38955 [Bradyrhizobium liaoningense]
MSGVSVTRRVFVNILTALPVVATEVSIVAAAPVEPHVDSELIVLGEQLKLESKRTNAFYAKADQLRRRHQGYEAALAALHYRVASVEDQVLAERLGWNPGGEDLTGRVFFPLYVAALEAKAEPHLISGAAARLSELVAAVQTIVLCDASAELVEADKCAEQAHEAALEIVEQIEQLQACTLAGFKVKLEAIRFCRAGELSNDEYVGSEGTDARLAHGVLMDLAAL